MKIVMLIGASGSLTQYIYDIQVKIYGIKPLSRVGPSFFKYTAQPSAYNGQATCRLL
jgi:hypothetical protein